MSEPLHAVLTAAVLLLTALLSALALGALWALTSAAGLSHPAWLAFPAAIVMAAVVRFSQPRSTGLAGVLAGLGTLLAAFYAECLQMLMRIAAQMGLPLIEVIRTSGIVGSAPLAWRLLPDRHLLIYLAAAALACLLTLVPRTSRR